MRLIRVAWAVCLWVLACAPIHAQEDRPRVAVIPFNHISVAKADAQTLTGVFETELVRTGAFDVIEQTQMDQILEAQEYAVSDCTDESCAIEFGKLLSAERIVLGALSAIGNRYVLNVKMIDVQTGKHVSAEKITADDLGTLPDDMRLLAYRIAGMTYQDESGETIATSFGQVFVETDPSGAEVFINGLRKGESPDLFEGVPRGTVVVESWKDDLYARVEVQITSEMSRVSMKLSPSVGALFVKSSITDVQVYVDGQLLGDLGSGLLEGIPVGEHLIELRGAGLYWSDQVLVAKDKTTRIQAAPREYGQIHYSLPEGAAAEIVGPSYREVVRGQGTLSPVWIGTYDLTVSGKKYESLTGTLEVETGMIVEIKPDLVLVGGGVSLSQRQAELQDLLAQRENGLIELATLDSRIAEAASSGRTQLTIGLAAASAGGASLIASLVCVLLSNSAYESYLTATDQSDIDAFAGRFQTLDIVSLITAGVGAAAGATGGVLILARPNQEKMHAERERLEKELEAQDARITEIEGELK